jgi:hypothetical protein
MKLCSQDEARMFRTAHDIFIKRINRMTVSALRVEYAAELADRGREILYGGPSSKQELIAALGQLRYPADRFNMTTHVLYHQGAVWSACAWCGGADATDAERALVEPEDAPAGTVAGA